MRTVDPAAAAAKAKSTSTSKAALLIGMGGYYATMMTAVAIALWIPCARAVLLPAVISRGGSPPLLIYVTVHRMQLWIRGASPRTAPFKFWVLWTQHRRTVGTTATGMIMTMTATWEHLHRITICRRMDRIVPTPILDVGR